MISRKYRIHAILLITFLVIVFYPQYSKKPDADKTTAATEAASEFLQLVDAGKLERSWQLSAEYLQKTVPLSDWQAKLNEMRATYGQVVARERNSASFTEAAEDLPETEFIQLTFDSEFQKQKTATETVTVLLNRDNSWQVVGYFIK